MTLDKNDEFWHLLNLSLHYDFYKKKKKKNMVDQKSTFNNSISVY